MTLSEGAGRSYSCPRCARVLVVYVDPARAPRCSKCNRAMVEAEEDDADGQLSLFSSANTKERKSSR